MISRVHDVVARTARLRFLPKTIRLVRTIIPQIQGLCATGIGADIAWSGV
jgi:hypothetical protein